MAQEISIPVYFARYNSELNDIVNDVSNVAENEEDQARKRESALSEIVNSISANGYQLVVSGTHHTADKQSKIPIIQGELYPIVKAANNKNAETSGNTKLPLIILTAHLDNFGLINVSVIDSAAI